MIEDCFNCCYAAEYMLWYWFPKFNPTCELGLPMHTNKKCEEFKQIGRNSR